MLNTQTRNTVSQFLAQIAENPLKVTNTSDNAYNILFIGKKGFK